MRSFKLDIVSPDGTVFSGEAERLLVRTTDGDVEILAGHTDLFATLGTGRVKLTTADGVKYGSSSGGLLTVRGGLLHFCSSSSKARKRARRGAHPRGEGRSGAQARKGSPCQSSEPYKRRKDEIT